MKFFNIAFGTKHLFHNKCKYRSRCAGYKRWFLHMYKNIG